MLINFVTDTKKRLNDDDVLPQGGQSQWPSGLRRRFATDRLLRLWARIPPGAGMSVCFERCMLSGKGLYDGMITCPEESYRVWCV